MAEKLIRLVIIQEKGGPFGVQHPRRLGHHLVQKLVQLQLRRHV